MNEQPTPRAHGPQVLGAFALVRHAATGRWAALSLPACPRCGTADAYVLETRGEALAFALAQMRANTN